MQPYTFVCCIHETGPGTSVGAVRYGAALGVCVAGIDLIGEIRA